MRRGNANSEGMEKACGVNRGSRGSTIWVANSNVSSRKKKEIGKGCMNGIGSEIMIIRKKKKKAKERSQHEGKMQVYAYLVVMTIANQDCCKSRRVFGVKPRIYAGG